MHGVTPSARSALDLGKLIAQPPDAAGVDFEMSATVDARPIWMRSRRSSPCDHRRTGSEVGRAGVITNEATHTRRSIFHQKLLPAIVIADPELSVGNAWLLPPARHGRACPTSSKPIVRRAIIRWPTHRGRRRAGGLRETCQSLCQRQDLVARAT